jgi:signal transduction histidine kinase
MKQASPLDFFEGEDKKHIQERIRETFEKGESDAEAGFISKDGTRRPYYFSGLLAHIGGKPCLIGMGLDISRRKQAEKMQALGQLAGGIAHDFNNHLSAIMGFAEILAEQVEEDSLRSYAEMIALAATRSADLTRQLLAFARKGKYMAEPVDVHSIIAEVVTFLGRSIDKRITIRQNLSADPSSILGDASQIQNALLNLAINSRDAMPGGGELTFSTSSESLDETRCKGLSLDIIPGRYIKISITDTGKGIDQKNLQHLFEPFFTTKDVGEGTGMGLAAVYGTVRNHKGGISVFSRPGQGSTFDIYLPVTDETDNTITAPALASNHATPSVASSTDAGIATTAAPRRSAK